MGRDLVVLLSLSTEDHAEAQKGKEQLSVCPCLRTYNWLSGVNRDLPPAGVAFLQQYQHHTVASMSLCFLAWHLRHLSQ